MPTKVWQPGEEVLSADFNPMVQEQVVATFANAAARDVAMPAPKLGQLCYLLDQKVMLEYSNASGVSAWHRPWNEPWGWVASYAPQEPHFGGESWIPGGGYTFPVRGRTLRVRFSGWAVKDVDGNDAHVVLRMVAGTLLGDGTGTVPVRDAVVTLHQGWTGHLEVEALLGSDQFPQVHFKAWTSWGTAAIAWSRINIIDVGPNPVAPQP